MAISQTVEIFSAGCPMCDDLVQRVQDMACDSCNIKVLSLNHDTVSNRVADLGIRSVPAVGVNGELAACCTDRGVDRATLEAASIGQPLN